MRKTETIIVSGLVAACLLIFGQVLWFDFINFDDNLYVYENRNVLAGINAASLNWAFTTFHSANWHPLTWISHMIDSSIFGRNAGGHHFVNLLFHAANSVLAYITFNRMTGDVWRAALVALLFAVHPAHVESVAWISERKDVLSTFFWLLTMLFYVRLAKGADGNRPLSGQMFAAPFLLVILCFALGLMSKPMLVTLPFVLLLCDYWPLERLKVPKDVLPLIYEKLPLFSLSLISAYITLRAQGQYGAIQTVQIIPVDVRILNAIVSYGKYIAMMFYPVDLGVGYAYQFPIPIWQTAVSAVLLAGVTLLCVWQRHERRYLLFGWLWFVGTMVPVIGLVQVGAQSMADRYTYIPYFGLFVMVIWGAAELASKLKANFANRAALASLVIAALSVLAFNQTSQWKNAKTLYTHTLNGGQGNFIIMHNLCNVLMNENRLAEAETQCRNSIAADPGFADSHISLGVANVRSGKLEEAIANFTRALEIRPNDAMAYGNLAAPLAMLGKPDEAEQSLNRSVDLQMRGGQDPSGMANSYANLAATFAVQNRFDKAAASLKKALEFAPDRADVRANYALALYFQNKFADARAEIQQAIRQAPDQAASYNIHGMILMGQGDPTGAVREFEKALKLKPDLKEAKDNLEKARMKTGT